jgi:hypothetical protein
MNGIRLVQTKHILDLFWKKQRSLKIVPMGAEAGIPLAHHSMDPLCKELPELQLEPSLEDSARLHLVFISLDIVTNILIE